MADPRNQCCLYTLYTLLGIFFAFLYFYFCYVLTISKIAQHSHRGHCRQIAREIPSRKQYKYPNVWPEKHLKTIKTQLRQNWKNLYEYQVAYCLDIYSCLFICFCNSEKFIEIILFRLINKLPIDIGFKKVFFCVCLVEFTLHLLTDHYVHSL